MRSTFKNYPITKFPNDSILVESENLEGGATLIPTGLTDSAIAIPGFARYAAASHSESRWPSSSNHPVISP